MLFAIVLGAGDAYAFCGAYIAEDGQELANRASRMVIARDGDATTLSMFNDVHGDATEFALVIPVPQGFDEDNIRLADHLLLDKIDAYTSPRRVTYTCEDFYTNVDRAAISTKATVGNDPLDTGLDTGGGTSASSSSSPSGCGFSGSSSSDASTWFEGDASTDDSWDDDPAWVDTATGTVVEEEFELGEYTAFVLDPKDGDGLQGWLDTYGFTPDPATGDALSEHIDDGSWFLALKVDAERIERTDGFLSALQIGYRTQALALPIKLGAASSAGVQDLSIVVVAADSAGQYGISNYVQRDAPDDECMAQLGDQSFYEWYEDRFTEAIAISADPLELEGVDDLGWITEYSWGQGKCDPCTEAGPLYDHEVEALGYGGVTNYEGYRVTRLRLRYTPGGVSSDLVLYGSQIQEDTQLRYVEHSWELESLLPVCVGEVDDPGQCYSSEWWALEAGSSPVYGDDVPVTEEPCGCSGQVGSRALLFSVPVLLWGLRRRWSA